MPESVRARTHRSPFFFSESPARSLVGRGRHARALLLAPVAVRQEPGAVRKDERLAHHHALRHADRRRGRVRHHVRVGERHHPGAGGFLRAAGAVRPEPAQFPVGRDPHLRVEGPADAHAVRIDHEHLAPGAAVIVARGKHAVVVVVLRRTGPRVPRRPETSVRRDRQAGDSRKRTLRHAMPEVRRDHFPRRVHPIRVDNRKRRTYGRHRARKGDLFHLLTFHFTASARPPLNWRRLGDSQLSLITSFMSHSIPDCRSYVNCGRRCARGWAFFTLALWDWKQPEQLVKTTLKRCAG